MFYIHSYPVKTINEIPVNSPPRDFKIHITGSGKLYPANEISTLQISRTMQ
jgi:hypothetical protein